MMSSNMGDVATNMRVMPFFMHAMSDVLAKRHSGNGMV